MVHVTNQAKQLDVFISTMLRGYMGALVEEGAMRATGKWSSLWVDLGPATCTNCHMDPVRSHPIFNPIFRSAAGPARAHFYYTCFSLAPFRLRRISRVPPIQPSLHLSILLTRTLLPGLDIRRPPPDLPATNTGILSNRPLISSSGTLFVSGRSA